MACQTSRPDFLQALWAQIEPADLRWIYLTHPDRDHTGSLMEILQAAPAARLVTTFLGLGILSLEYQIDTPVTHTVDEILGRPATDFATWAADHAESFGGMAA